MAHKAPGRHYRKGLSLIQLTEMFPDDESAENWFVETRWPNVVCCPLCGSVSVQIGTTHPQMPYRCRDCRKFFSVKTGTLMQGSNLKYRQWAIAIYLMSTGIKGTSSMKLHRDLGITQKAAWHLSHRIRESWSKQSNPFAGPVEVDETYIGGKERNNSRQQEITRWDWRDRQGGCGRSQRPGNRKGQRRGGERHQQGNPSWIRSQQHGARHRRFHR